MEPLDADSTIVVWSTGEFDSKRKSLPEYCFAVLCGNVFLTRFDLLKSNVWSNLSVMTCDL